MKDGKIAVLESEAEQVRLIFRRYLELSGVNALVRDLKERNILDRKLPRPDRSHKPWREASGGAQCGKSACCVATSRGLAHQHK